MSSKQERLRNQILAGVEDYYKEAFAAPAFIPGDTPVPVAGRVFDAEEIRLLMESALDFWLTAGRFAAHFEKDFASFCGTAYAVLTNSGSSANLLALSSLTSPVLKERQLKSGDEVITVAAGFPTTVNPILQNGLVPVFVDVDIPTYNLKVSDLEAAWSPRTKAIILAHTLGNPFDLKAVTEFAARHGLFLIEDCCDAIGSTYEGRLTGTFGDLATASFYPAHHLTMGEGGCVMGSDMQLVRIVQSLRDWGRDCWCDPGMDNSCLRRFDWQLGDLPAGYDHKYVYSHIGYNLKATDMQAAVGLAQLKKLPHFIAARRKNFEALYTGLKDLENFFLLPNATPNSNPSWFGFPLAVRSTAPFTLNDIVRHLNAQKIGTRLLFGGNLTKQPAYKDVHYRKVGDLPNSDFVMRNVFWLGVYPGLTTEMLQYVLSTLHAFCARY